MLYFLFQEILTENIDASKLELHPVQDTSKVQNPKLTELRFKQPLLYNGGKLVLSTQPFHTKELIVRPYNMDKSILVPVNRWLRKQLDIIEEFVTLSVDLPAPFKESWKASTEKDTPYKKIWDGPNMFIPVSRWCKYYQYSPDSALSYRAIDNAVGEGMYTITFEVPELYIGHHANNKLISVTLRIVEVIIQPILSNIDKVIEAVLSTEGCDEQEESGKRKRRNKKITS